MSLLAPTLQAFFTQRLYQQRQASPHTIAAYRDTFRLLLRFAQERTGKAPSQLEFANLDAPLIGAFLQYLEITRRNRPRSRNARLAAIHSLFRFAALDHPENAAVIQRVLAIPHKRFDRALVSFLSRDEIDALLASPDRDTWTGRRDHAFLLVAIQSGLRVSELIQLRRQDVQLATGPHLRCYGKGRKERTTPLTAQGVGVLHVWLQEHDGQPDSPLFPTRRGQALSRDGAERLVTRHVATAQHSCNSLRSKRVSPHVLRHTAAMQLLHAGIDTSTIALWLGHYAGDLCQVAVGERG